MTGVQTCALPIYFHLDNVDENKALMINKLLLDHLRASFPYTGTDIYGDYNGILVGKNKIVATNKYKFYEGTDIPVEDIYFLHNDLVRLILTSDPTDSIIINSTDNINIMVVNTDEFTIYTTKQVNMEVIPVDSPEFIASYNHSNSFICNRQDFVKILNFLDIFNKNYINQRVFLIIQSETEANIEVNENDIVVRQLPIENVMGKAVGMKICLSLPYIKIVLSTLKTTKVKIQIDTEKPALNFTGVSDDEDIELKRHIVIVRLEE